MTATMQEQTRIFVVLNPVAGSANADDIRQALARHLGEQMQAAFYETTGAQGEDVVAIVRDELAHNPSVVVAAGGDGTISNVAEALIGTGTRLGIIPAGTANVLARELGIPLDLETACALLDSQPNTTSIDAMKVGKQFFVLQIGIGIDSLMIRDTARQAKRRFGRAAYMWTAFTRLIGYQPTRFTIVADGKRLRPRASQVLIANGGVLGMPPFRWGPNIRPDDGKIDVCIVSARTALDYVSLIWHTIMGQQRRDRNVRYLTAQRNVAISADQPLPIQADGEIIGETPIQIEVVPNALKVIVPATMPPAAAVAISQVAP